MSVDAEEYHAKWEGMWGTGDGVKPGQAFDAERSAPALVNFLQSDEGQAAVKGKDAVVPGCGRGYDVVAFQQAGATRSVGVEISPSAAKVASDYVKSQASDGTRVEVITADWLEDRSIQPYDVGYDYTFLCALHPDMRSTWAAAWQRNLKPGGTLLALEFPLEPEGRTGPPWPLSHDIYKGVLEPAGFELVKREMVAEENATRADRAGREAFAIWRRK